MEKHYGEKILGMQIIKDKIAIQINLLKLLRL